MKEKSKSFENVRRYNLEEELGGGSMGVVYKGEDPLLSRKVVIKVMLPDPFDKEASEKRFLREARALAILEHPNIVKIYDFGVAKIDNEDKNFMVMEYVNGDSLTKLIGEYSSDAKNLTNDSVIHSKPTSNKVPDKETLLYRMDIFHQIVMAMEYAHSNGVAHRDLKPDNIIVDYNHIKIIDFGLALMYDRHDVTIPGKTPPGKTPFGSPPYSAPEQIREGLYESGELADIYSLGAILFELVTGHMLYEEELLEYMAKYGDAYCGPMYDNLIKKPLPQPRLYNPDISPLLEGVILRCLQISKNRRFKNLSELRASFEDCFNSDFSGFEKCASLRTASGQAFNLVRRQSFILGRSRSADIIDLAKVDSDKKISRHHGCVTYNDGNYFYEDLGSTNHSYLNGTKLTANEQEKLRNGDQLRLGNVEFTFEIYEP